MRIASAKASIAFLEREVFYKYGAPAILISDNGPQLIASILVRYAEGDPHWVLECSLARTSVRIKFYNKFYNNIHRIPRYMGIGYDRCTSRWTNSRSWKSIKNNMTKNNNNIRFDSIAEWDISSINLTNSFGMREPHCPTWVTAIVPSWATVTKNAELQTSGQHQQKASEKTKPIKIYEQTNWIS